MLYKVEGAEVNPAVKPDELVIAVPTSTKITDARFDPPLHYVQGEKELTMAELKAMHDKSVGGAAKVGSPAPGWELKTLDGTPARLEDFRGKVVLLTWFASWCGPCNAEAPPMEKNVWQKYRAQGLVVVGINAGEREDPRKMAQSFVSMHGVTYPVVLDVDDEATQAYQVEAFPAVRDHQSERHPAVHADRLRRGGGSPAGRATAQIAPGQQPVEEQRGEAVRPRPAVLCPVNRDVSRAAPGRSPVPPG